MFDILIAIEKSSLDDESYSHGLSMTAISPGVVWHAVKQSEEFPLSVALSASYASYSFSHDDFDSYDIEMKGSGLTFGATVYSAIESSPTIQLIPQAGFFRSSRKIELVSPYGSDSDDDPSTSFSLGVALAFKQESQQIFFINPSIDTSEGDTSFSIGLGFVFLSSIQR